MQATIRRTFFAQTRLSLASACTSTARCYSARSTEQDAESATPEPHAEQEEHQTRTVYGFKLRPVKAVRAKAAKRPSYEMERPILPLPEPPPRPPYPTAWLEDEDCHIYLEPLYRRMWRISHKRTFNDKTGVFKRVLWLGKHMTFTERHFADEYVQRLTDFLDRARHNGRHIEQIENDVFYATNTFNAYQTKKDRRKFPGITRHDIYFAYQAETLWEEYLFTRKAILPPPSVKSLGVMVRSVRAYGISVSKWITNKASEFVFGDDINREVSEDAGDTTASPASPPPTEQEPSS